MEREKALIRLATPEDASQFYEIHSHPSVYANLLMLPWETGKIWEKRLEEQKDNYILVAEYDGQIIGVARLKVNDRPRCKHCGCIAMSVRYGFQGQGFGSLLMEKVIELADQWLNLRRLELHVHIDNQPAINLYRKYGFNIEGELKDYTFKNGEFVNVYCMGRITSST